jgi:hypothetical protein
MKKLLVLLFSAFLSIPSFAQQQELSSVKVGKDFKGNSKGPFVAGLFNLEKPDGSICSVTIKVKIIGSNRYIIDLFDANMNHKKQHDFKAPEKYGMYSGQFINDDLIFIGIHQTKPTAKTFKVDFKNKKIIELDEIFNYSDMPITNPKRYSFSIGGISLSGNTDRVDMDGFGLFETSKLGNYYVYIRDLKSKKDAREMHHLVVFDREYNLVYEKKIDLPVKDEMLDLLSVSVDDNANVIIVTKNYEQGKRKETKRQKGKDKQANYHMEFVFVNKDTISIQKLEEENLFLTDLTTVVSNDQVYIGSLYSDEKEDRVKGVITAVYNIKNLQRISYNKTPFSDQVVAQLENTKRDKKVKRKKKKESETLVGHSLLVGDNGSITFIAEEQYTIEQIEYDYANKPKGLPTLLYYRNDIVVTKINPDGSLAYMKVIDKRQSSGGRFSPADSRLHGFTSFLVNNNVHIFLNAWKIEVEEGVTTVVNNLKSKNLALYNIQIDSNGDVFHKEIVPVKRGKNIPPEISKATLLEDKGFITSGKWGNVSRFVKVIF